jgi:hypothetical protein
MGSVSIAGLTSVTRVPVHVGGVSFSLVSCTEHADATPDVIEGTDSRLACRAVGVSDPSRLWENGP